MIEIKQLKAVALKPERTVTPQCSAETTESTSPRYRGWRMERYKSLRPQMDPLRCQRESCVEIDGKPYCRAHGGQLALQYWINGALVKNELARSTNRE